MRGDRRAGVRDRRDRRSVELLGRKRSLSHLLGPTRDGRALRPLRVGEEHDAPAGRSKDLRRQVEGVEVLAEALLVVEPQRQERRHEVDLEWPDQLDGGRAVLREVAGRPGFERPVAHGRDRLEEWTGWHEIRPLDRLFPDPPGDGRGRELQLRHAAVFAARRPAPNQIARRDVRITCGSANPSSAVFGPTLSQQRHSLACSLSHFPSRRSGRSPRERGGLSSQAFRFC